MCMICYIAAMYIMASFLVTFTHQSLLSVSHESYLPLVTSACVYLKGHSPSSAVSAVHVKCFRVVQMVGTVIA